MLLDADGRVARGTVDNESGDVVSRSRSIRNVVTRMSEHLPSGTRTIAGTSLPMLRPL